LAFFCWAGGHFKNCGPPKEFLKKKNHLGQRQKTNQKINGGDNFSQLSGLFSGLVFQNFVTLFFWISFLPFSGKKHKFPKKYGGFGELFSV